MECFNILFDASLHLEEKVETSKAENLQAFFTEDLAQSKTLLDNQDYYYLSLFLEVLISSKKASSSKDSDSLRFGCFAHLLRDKLYPKNQ